MSAKNTKEKGKIRMIYFNDKDLIFGVCLDFNLISYGSRLDDVRNKLEKMAIDYLDFVNKNQLSDSMLNRHAPKVYWDMYKNAHKEEVIKKLSGSQKSLTLSTGMQFYPSFVMA